MEEVGFRPYAFVGQSLHVNTDNTLNAQKTLNGQYVDDTLLTNHFKYDEKIGAGYINLHRSFKNVTIQAGLRTEYTSSTGTLIQADDHSVKRSYLDFFPSVSSIIRLTTRMK